ENLLVAARGAAAVSGGELLPLLVRARIARADGELARALHCIGEHIGPPAHTQTGDTQRSLHLIDSAASRATLSSNCQSPPPAAPTIATLTATPASSARAIALAMIFFAPAAVSRRASATSMVLLLAVYIRPCPFRTSSTSWSPPTISTRRATGMRECLACKAA